MLSHTVKTAVDSGFLPLVWVQPSPLSRAIVAFRRSTLSKGNFAQAPGYIDPDAETLHPDGKLQEQRWHNLHAAIRPLKVICRYANKDVPVVLPDTIDTCVWDARRAARALLLTEPRGERASAALPRRQAKRRAESAPCLKRDRRPRRAPEGRPRWPEGQHPNPPPKAGKGALRRAHPGTSGTFLVRP